MRPPSLIDVIEGVRNPLLLQHSIPFFTQEERLATTGERAEQRRKESESSVDFLCSKHLHLLDPHFQRVK